MSEQTWAAVFLIASPAWFNVAFARLAKGFDYPRVLREPAGTILARFRAGGSGLVWMWWTFAASGLLLIPMVILLSAVATPGGGVLVALGIAIAV